MFTWPLFLCAGVGSLFWDEVVWTCQAGGITVIVVYFGLVWPTVLHYAITERLDSTDLQQVHQLLIVATGLSMIFAFYSPLLVIGHWIAYLVIVHKSLSHQVNSVRSIRQKMLRARGAD